jgi:hypothetical protein
MVFMLDSEKAKDNESTLVTHTTNQCQNKSAHLENEGAARQ